MSGAVTFQSEVSFGRQTEKPPALGPSRRGVLSAFIPRIHGVDEAVFSPRPGATPTGDGPSRRTFGQALGGGLVWLTAMLTPGTAAPAPVPKDRRPVVSLPAVDYDAELDLHGATWKNIGPAQGLTDPIDQANGHEGMWRQVLDPIIKTNADNAMGVGNWNWSGKDVPVSEKPMLHQSWAHYHLERFLRAEKDAFPNGLNEDHYKRLAAASRGLVKGLGKDDKWPDDSMALNLLKDHALMKKVLAAPKDARFEIEKPKDKK